MKLKNMIYLLLNNYFKIKMTTVVKGEFSFLKFTYNIIENILYMEKENI